MKPAGGRVGVFRGAGGAQRKAPHRGARPVVGQRLDHAVARAAAHAGGERVAVAPVRGIADFAQALLAGREVGHHDRGTGLLVRAWRHRESAGAERRLRADLPSGDHRMDGRFRRQPVEEARQRCRRALRLDQHPAAGVADEAGEPGLPRQPVHERTEADTLHRAGNRDPQPLPRDSRRSGRFLVRPRPYRAGSRGVHDPTGAASYFEVHALQQQVLRARIGFVGRFGDRQPRALGHRAERLRREMLAEMPGRQVGQRAEPHPHAHHPMRAARLRRGRRPAASRRVPDLSHASSALRCRGSPPRGQLVRDPGRHLVHRRGHRRATAPPPVRNRPPRSRRSPAAAAGARGCAPVPPPRRGRRHGSSRARSPAAAVAPSGPADGCGPGAATGAAASTSTTGSAPAQRSSSASVSPSDSITATPGSPHPARRRATCRPAASSPRSWLPRPITSARPLIAAAPPAAGNASRRRCTDRSCGWPARSGRAASSVRQIEVARGDGAQIVLDARLVLRRRRHDPRVEDACRPRRAGSGDSRMPRGASVQAVADAGARRDRRPTGASGGS